MESALSTIRAILKRHADYAGRFAVPGDWGERAFRGWLVLDLLHGYMKWPSSHILLGERHDILLLNDSLSPVITVETKRPDYDASKSEWKNFEARLPHYGTLRWAFLTNGKNWTRLEILAPKGKIQIRSRQEIDVTKASEEDAAKYFGTLRARQYLA
jgi:hypothetical protein